MLLAEPLCSVGPSNAVLGAWENWRKVAAQKQWTFWWTRLPMQVWKQVQREFQRQFPGTKRDSENSEESRCSSACTSASSDQRSSASTFYVSVGDDDMNVMPAMDAKADENNSAIDRNGETTVKSTTACVNSDGSVVKPAVLPKPSKLKKPELLDCQQPQHADALAVNCCKQHANRLVLCPRETLFPPGFSRSLTAEPTRTAVSDVASVKPMPPVCYQSFVSVGYIVVISAYYNKNRKFHMWQNVSVSLKQ